MRRYRIRGWFYRFWIAGIVIALLAGPCLSLVSLFTNHHAHVHVAALVESDAQPSGHQHHGIDPVNPEDECCHLDKAWANLRAQDNTSFFAKLYDPSSETLGTGEFVTVRFITPGWQHSWVPPSVFSARRYKLYASTQRYRI